MKTIVYQGREYHLPKVKLNYIVSDSDGVVIGYIDKPTFDGDWCNKGDYYILSPVINAEDSLIEL